MSETGLDGPPGGVAPDDAVIDPPTGEPRGGAVRSSVVFGVLLVVLLIVAAVGARMMLAEFPDRTAAEPEEVVCWNGKTLLETECGTPNGRAGLRWMFPSFRPEDQACRNVTAQHPRSSRPVIFECRVRTSAGPATLTYSQLSSVEGGRQFLEKKYGSEPEELEGDIGPRLLWTEGDEPRGDTYELEVIYADLPFSVEVAAGSARARDEVLESLVRFRPVPDAFVRPVKGAVSALGR